MRVVMVTLSGDADKAEEFLRTRYDRVEAIPAGRELLEKGSMVERLTRLRRLQPDVFAVVTESLEWQYGQAALMYFGALGGARESIVVDSSGRSRARRRPALLAFSPFQLATSFIAGKASLAKAETALKKLEREVTLRRVADPQPVDAGNISAAYLRASPAPGTQPGGATSHINGVVKALLQLGVAVRFISNDEIVGLDRSTVDFVKIAPDPGVMPRAAFDVFNGMRFSAGAADLIIADKPDFIYQRYSRFSWAGVEASFRAQVPLFLEYNGSEVWIGKNWDSTQQLELLERCERLNLEAATRIFVISEVERNNLLQAGIDAEKIIVNPNGVDAEVFRPGIGGTEERTQLDIPRGQILVGFVGTFGPWHGVLALADAISLVPKEAPIHFLLIGDGSLRGEVEERLTSSGDLGRVTFAGVISHDRVPPLLDACEVLVSPHVPLADGSDFFGSPTKLFEYMAMGKGIVASRLGQIGDVLANNETALLVEPGNVAELSKAITKMAGDHDLRDRLGKAARQAALNQHTWLRNGERLLEALGH